MKTLTKLICALPLTLLAGCPGESDAAENTEAPEVSTEEIDAAAEDAANKIDETNADDELENLETEVDSDDE